MLNGIYVDLDSARIAEHFRERAQHHTDKAAAFRKNAEALQQNSPETSVSNRPWMDLEHRAERHEAEAQYFTFLSETLVPNETYRLTRADLEQLEFIGKRYIQ